MGTVARHARLLLVLSLATTAGLAAHAQGGGRAGGAGIVQMPADPEATKGTGIVLGQVVDGTSGRPIGGVVVTITGGTTPSIELVNVGLAPASGGTPASSAPRQIVTEGQGRFMFRELTRGRYTVRATAPGYLAAQLGQTRPGGLGQSLELPSDDEKRGDLVIRIWKSASISGTILDEAGEPVPGLSLRSLRRTMLGGAPRFASGLTVTTDDRGVYRMPNLVPGSYLVAVFTTQSAMPIATSEAYMQLVMSGGNYTNSELYRELTNSGASASMAMMGGYRVGDYVLSSGREIGLGGGPPLPLDENKLLSYPTQFYPASSTAATATVITLGSGEERSGVDLQLKLVTAVKLSGVVTGPDGPVRNIGLRLLPQDTEAFSTETGLESASTVTDGNGAFTFFGVTPGQYTIKVLRIPRPLSSALSSTMTMIEVSGPNGMIMGMGTSAGASAAPPPALPIDATLWGNVPVTVAESDLSGLTVALRPGVRISGRIEFVGAKEKPAPDQIQRTSLSITPSGGAQLSTASAAKRVETDGRFNTVGYPPGRYLVSASMITATTGVSGWTFRSATVGGRDVSSEGLEITGEDITGLVITFSDQTTELTGQVMDERGQADKTALVVVFPADTDSWKRGVMNARRMRSVRTSTLGTYAFAGLPPGAYYAAALPDATTTEWQDPKVLESIVSVATRVTIDDGETKTQQLTTRPIR